MRLTDLSLDGLPTNSLLCQLRYDSSPCHSSSSSLVFSSPVFILLLSFFSESVLRIYRERERERAIQKKDTEQKSERESIQYKKEGNTVEKKMKSGTLERREREQILRYSDRNRFS